MRRRSLPSAVRGDSQIKIRAPAPTPPPPLRFHLGRRAQAEEAERRRFLIKLSPPASTPLPPLARTHTSASRHICTAKKVHTHTQSTTETSSSQGSGEPIQGTNATLLLSERHFFLASRSENSWGHGDGEKSSCFFLFFVIFEEFLCL